MSTLTLVAVTHQQAPFTTLERVSLDADTASAVALELRARPGIDEAVVLSTCNRTELYLAGVATCEDDAIAVLAAHTGSAPDHLRDVSLVLTDDDASLHLFRVAAGLESRVLGEGEILGQVRAAARRALGHPASGPALSSLFRWAAASGRRARRTTGGPTPPSLARTALDAAGTLRPEDLTIVLGAGAMAAALVAELRARQLRYLVANRRPDRAALLTRRPQDAIALDDLGDHLPGAALVVCATGARTPVVSPRTIARGGRRSATRPLTVVDLSMPRNVDPEVAHFDDVRLIRLEHLTGDGGGDLLVRRSSEAVATEHRRYRLWLAGRAAGPIIAALREQVTRICLDEASRHLDPATAAVVARRTAGRVLHGPTLAVKELSEQGDIAALDALGRALGLEPTASFPPDGLVREAS